MRVVIIAWNILVLTAVVLMLIASRVDATGAYNDVWPIYKIGGEDKSANMTLEEYRDYRLGLHELSIDSYDVKGPGTMLNDAVLSTDEDFISGIQDVLNAYRFTQSYMLNVFDCDTMSTIAWYELTRYGYDARIIASFSDNGNHAFVGVVSPENEWVMIETTKGPTYRNIGMVENGIEDEEDFFRDGLAFNSSMELSFFFPSGFTLVRGMDYAPDYLRVHPN